jgi:hypothetical protein
VQITAEVPDGSAGRAGVSSDRVSAVFVCTESCDPLCVISPTEILQLSSSSSSPTASTPDLGIRATTALSDRTIAQFSARTALSRCGNEPKYSHSSFHTYIDAIHDANPFPSSLACLGSFQPGLPRLPPSPASLVFDHELAYGTSCSSTAACLGTGTAAFPTALIGRWS